MRRAIWIMCLAMACGGDKTDEEEGPGPAPDEVPDVTGRYNVQIAGATGCEGQSYWLEQWVPGSLKIEGESDSLSFDFGDGIELGGAVDMNKKFSFQGEAQVEASVDTGSVDAHLSIFNDGSFSQQDDGCFVMDGDFEVVVDEDGLLATNCTIVAPIKAYQLEGSACDGLQGS
jgi:hypothetical protein